MTPRQIDTLRRQHATQVMAEGDLPFGPASCSASGNWSFGGYGPQPAFDFSANGWNVK